LKEERCTQCQELWPAEELLEREDNGKMVCPACSGLLTDEELSCRYDEVG